MKRIADWIERLHRLSADDGVSVHFFRAIVPSQYEFELFDALIALEPRAALARRPGDAAPYCWALLRLPDDRQEGHGEVEALAKELGGVLTLLSDRRVEIATEIALDDGAKIHFMGHASCVDRALVGPLPATLKQVVQDGLSRITSLSSSQQEVIGSAIRLHHASALLCERDVASAYVLLVAALEVLSRDYGAPPTEWADWPDAVSWDKALEKLGTTADQRSVIREKLLSDKNLRLKQTFKIYGSERLPEAFWDQEYEEWEYTFRLHQDSWELPTVRALPVAMIVPRDRTVIRSALAKSYDLRSGIVHQGSELSMYDTILREQRSMTADQPVPYAILRMIVSALIKHEWFSLAAANPLPKFTIPPVKRPPN